MKIQVSKLEANPYRKISKYKYDKKKLKALRISIKETTFWDNILVRPHPTKKGFYQIAYGHHRWKVLLNLKQKYIDVPVRKLTNAYMLKIMANENLEQWKLTPSIANETIEQARNFLTDILNKYKTWNDIRMVEEDRAILNVNNGQTFAAIKKAKKVGHDTIKHFLGDNWPIWVIRDAIGTLDIDEYDREAVEELPTIEHSAVFKSEVRDRKLSKPSQKKLARTIKSEGIGVRGIRSKVSGMYDVGKKKKTKKKKTIKEIPYVDEVLPDITIQIEDLFKMLNKVKGDIKYIQNRYSKNRFMSKGKSLYKLMTTIFEG